MTSPTPDTSHFISSPNISSVSIPGGSGAPSVGYAAAGLAGQGAAIPMDIRVNAAINRGMISQGAFKYHLNQLQGLKKAPEGRAAALEKDTANARAAAEKTAKMADADADLAKKLRKYNIGEMQKKLAPRNKVIARVGDEGLKRAAKAFVPQISRQIAARTLPLALGMAAHGLGPAVGIALWCLDPSERRLFNDFIWRSHAPALDAPPNNLGQPNYRPEFGTTHFLPVAADGNRDPSIRKMDAGMTETMAAAFGYHPDNVWPPSNPAIATTPDFGQVIEKANSTIKNTTAWAQGFQNTINKLNGKGQLVDATIATARPQVAAMGELGETVLPKAGAGLVDAAAHANDFYQHFREINYRNRAEIANSNSRIIPFLPAKVDEGKMDDSLAAAKSALDKMQQTGQQIATAGDGWTIPVPETSSGPAASEPVNQAVETSYTAPDRLPGLGGLSDVTPDALKKGLPDLPQMPSMPQMPGLGGGSPMGGGMPGGGMPGGMPGGGMPMGGTPPLDPNDPNNLKGLLDDKNKENDKDPDLNPDDKKGDEDEADPAAADGTGVVTPGAVPGAGGNPDGAPPITEGESPQGNTAEIGGKTRTFDTPKAAQMAHLMSMPGEGGGKTIEQAAAEAGYSLPSPDSDIGEQVDPSQIKPGDVIKSQPESGVYIGDGEVITESGQVKPIADVMAGMDGPHQGIFRLADDGAPAAGVSGGSPSGDHSMPNLDAGGAVPPGLENTDNDPGTASGSSYSPTGITPGGIPGGM